MPVSLSFTSLGTLSPALQYLNFDVEYLNVDVEYIYFNADVEGLIVDVEYVNVDVLNFDWVWVSTVVVSDFVDILAEVGTTFVTIIIGWIASLPGGGEFSSVTRK